MSRNTAEGIPDPFQTARVLRSMSFSLQIDPSTLSTAQQKGAMPYIGKDGRPHIRFYTKAKVSKAEKLFLSLLAPHAKEAASLVTPNEEPAYSVSISFAFPHLKSSPKSVRSLEFAPMNATPDVDNLAKALLDSMTEAGLWKDDSRIASLHLSKFRTRHEPRIIVSISTLQFVDTDTLKELLP